MLRPSSLQATSALAGCLSICLLLCPAQRLRAADDSDSTIIAQVGDTQVTAGEIRTALQSLDANTQAAAIRDPASLSKVVRLLLAQRLVLKEALAKKWDQDPSVTAALERLRDNAISQTYLQSVSQPPPGYPSDAEVQAAYDANKSKMMVPRQFHISQIFVADPKGSDPTADAKAQVKLDAVRKALAKKDADFAAVASAESDDASTTNGGDLGWLLETRIQPEIRSQLGSLSKGGVTPPIRLDDGWHFLKVLQIKDAHVPTFDEVKSDLAQRMRVQRAQENSQKYVAKLMQDNPVQVNELALSKVIKQP